MQVRLTSTCSGRALAATYASHFDKGNQQTEKSMRTLASKTLKVPRMNLRGSKSELSRGTTVMPKDALKSTLEDEPFATVKSMLADLKMQLQCDAVLFVSMGANNLPKLLSTTSTAKVRR